MKIKNIIKGFGNGHLRSGIKVFCCLCLLLLVVGQVSADVRSVNGTTDNPQEEFDVYYQNGNKVCNEPVYARGTTNGNDSDLYVCKCEWEAGDALSQPKCQFVGVVTNDGSGGPGKFKIRVDDRINDPDVLPCECFDIVLDNHQDGWYNASVDDKDETGTTRCVGCNPNGADGGFHFNKADLNGTEIDNLQSVGIDFDQHGSLVDIYVISAISTGNTTNVSLPVVVEIKINGVTVDTISTTFTQIASWNDTTRCWFTSCPCGSPKKCGKATLGPFELFGDCVCKVVPWFGDRCLCQYIGNVSSSNHAIHPGSTISVTLDPYNEVSEYNETDNMMSVIYSPPGLPALSPPGFLLALVALLGLAAIVTRKMHKR